MLYASGANCKGISTISFFRFKGRNKWWGLSQMQFLHPKLKKVKGISFVKYLGSGGGYGFSIKPDLSVYALLISWQTEGDFREFMKSHYYSDFLEHAHEVWTIAMVSTASKGKWDGVNPFSSGSGNVETDPVAVLTRATLRPQKLIEFWRYVPLVNDEVQSKNGLILSKGFGELPFIKPATFSLWDSNESMMDFAYKSKYHQKVIPKTRIRGWYKEELFARFVPLYTTGAWNGSDPLLNLIPQL